MVCADAKIQVFRDLPPSSGEIRRKRADASGRSRNTWICMVCADAKIQIVTTISVTIRIVTLLVVTIRIVTLIASQFEL